MKKQFLLLIVLCLASVFRVGATQIHVTSTATFASAWTAYSVGDTITLASGSYATSALTITKGVTIMAEPTAATKPILFQTTFLYSTTGCSLTLDGVEAYYDVEGVATPTTSRYFITSTAAVITIPLLKIKDCSIHGYGRTLLRCDNANATSITNLNVSNSTIYDMGRENPSYSVFALKTAKVSNATFTNSTIYNCANGFWYSEIVATPIVFSMEKCCLIKNTSTLKGIPTVTVSKKLFNANANPSSSYTFKDCIISDSNDGTTTYLSLQLNSNNTTIIGNINNTILANNFAATRITGTLTTNTEVVTTALSYDWTTLKINTTPTTITGIGDPRWSLNPVVAVPATLSTSVSPLGAGTVTVSPNSPTYNVGDQITLTQTRNFGYQFKEWQDGSGNVLSSNASYVFNIQANTTVKAVYNTLTTYAYTVAKSGSQWGNVSLSPAATNGRYESGTTVTMSVVPNAVTNFLYWEDNTTGTSRTILVDADKSFTATFDQIPFIVGWNFLAQDVRSARIGDFYSDGGNTGTISLYEPTGTAVNWLASLASFSPSYPCIRIWTAAASFATTRRYFQASFSTTGFKNVQVKSMVGGNYQCYAVQKMQYSLDGINFTDLNSTDITSVYNAGWKDLNATLPIDAEGQTKVYVRWIADVTSPVLGTAADNDGMALTNVFVYADVFVANDVTPPSLVSSVPAEASTYASANGSISLTFDEKMIAGTGNCTLGATTLMPSFGSKTVTFPYSKLAYDTNYSFTVPAGALTDMSGNPYAGITVNFKTMVRPQPLAKVFDFVVAQDGSGNGTTIQSAFDAAPLNSANPYLIFVKNGTYSEYPSLAVNKNKVHLIGQSQDGVVITGSHYSGLVVNGVTLGTSTSQTVEILANDFYAENITIANTAGAVGQAVALKQYGDRGAMKNVKLSGFQDTHLTGTGSNVRQLYQNCRIEGAIDYIFGGGDIFFDQCLLYCVGRVGGDVCTAPSTLVTQTYGYVFNSCTIDGDAATQNNQFLLGRPWQNAPRSIYLNTKMNIVPATLGWTDMAVIPALFAEYNSTTSTNSVIDLSNRKSSFTTDASHGSATTSGLQTVLTDNQAAQYTLDNVLKGTDSWQPLMLTETTEAPVNLTIGSGTLNWDATNYAICYIISRNNVVVGITTATTYTDATYSKSVVYDVMAVSESGALSAKKSISGEVTGLSALGSKIISYTTNNELVLTNLPLQSKVEVYSFSGKLLQSAKSNATSITFPMLESNAIVRVISDKETVVMKVTKK